tara:strand:+ start:9653 stop:11761 length:2109 start_codon:yes stop_codon:yes gene_type:complete
MKDRNIKVDKLVGIFESFPQPANNLQELINWQVDQYTEGWNNHFGYEPYGKESTYIPFSVHKIDSLYYVQRHQGAQDSILFEQNGSLFLLNDFIGTLGTKVLSQNRTIPSASEVGTQYIQFGRYIIYANGYDKPAKTRLWPITSDPLNNYLVEYPLGFDNVPSAPVVWNIETDITATASGQNSTSIFFYTVDYVGDDPKQKGIGIAENNKKNKYRYRVSFVNTAGSESPLSPISNVVEWTTQNGAAQLDNLLFAITVEIPIGNNDVIARRIYRTKNYSDDSLEDGNTFYFVAEIPNNADDFYIDDLPDTGLGAESPNDLDSVAFPARDCRFLGTYKNCLFIDGGKDDDLTIFYSHPAAPDRFAALSFLTLSHRQGGGLTGFFSYFNNMLAFREYSIDIIRGTYPNFTATNLVRYVGTRATETIIGVEGLGVLFLSYDGVYSININTDYNDNPTVENITPHLRDTFARINIDAMTRASAVYSKKRREYIVHFPIDGSPVNNIGLVFHTDKRTWSMRKDIPVGKLVVNSVGDVLFGMNDDSVSSDNEHGIMVLSKKRAAGTVIADRTLTDLPPFTSTIRSAWLDMGDSSIKKKIHSVYLFIATGGDQDIPLNYFMDFNYNSNDLTEGLRQQRPDFQDQQVYDKVILDQGFYWEEPLVTTIRYDVYSSSCSHFQWMIQTNADVHIIGYAIDFTTKGTRVIQGKKL